MPFLPAGVGAAVAGGVASAAVGAGISALTASGQSGAISSGQAAANAALAPYSATGVQSNTQQSNLLGLNGQDAADKAMGTFQSSPGYDYQVQQGIRGVDAGAASQGMLHSGATLKAEETLGANLANQNFQQYYNNLNSLSNFGITAAGGQASTDTSAAGAQAGIIGAEGKSVSTAIGGGITNALTGLGTNGSGASSAGPTNTLTNPNTGTTYQSSLNPDLNF